jgi:hypothetical protein
MSTRRTELLHTTPLLISEKKVLGRTNRLLSFHTRTAQKTTSTILSCRGNVFIELLPSTDRGIHRPTNSPRIKTRTAQKLTSLTILILLHVFVAEGTCLPSSFLAAKGIHFTEPLPSNDRKDTNTDRLIGGIYEIRR